nr:hypothetical protein [Chitinophaga sp. YR573]
MNSIIRASEPNKPPLLVLSESNNPATNNSVLGTRMAMIVA